MQGGSEASGKIQAVSRQAVQSKGSAHQNSFRPDVKQGRACAPERISQTGSRSQLPHHTLKADDISRATPCLTLCLQLSLHGGSLSGPMLATMQPVDSSRKLSTLYYAHGSTFIIITARHCLAITDHEKAALKHCCAGC